MPENMSKHLVFLMFLLPFLSFGQNSQVTVKVTDYGTKQPVSGAKVILSDKFKALSDPDGVAVFQDVPRDRKSVV